MRFLLLQDGVPNGTRRFQEMVREAVFAEEMGFYGYGVSETHFTGYGVSAPEIIMGAVAANTTRLRLRFASAVLLAFNHPIRVAERLTTLDALSDGRAEIATSRSNQLVTLRSFNIDPSATRRQWSESLEALVQALTNETFEYHGEVWDIPPSTLMPRTTQQPHPPIFVSATSLESHRLAGERGLGVLSGNSLPGGWEYVEACVDTYRAALENCDPLTPEVFDSFGTFSLKTHIAADAEQAKADAKEMILRNVETVIDMYSRISESSPDYQHLSRILEVVDRKRDLDYLIDRAPYYTVGTPDFLIERCERLQALGVNEFLMTIEGMTHEKHLEAIRLIGEEVIPRFASTEPGVTG
jgi:alkanesulfonate monooxygenase SsuD/methylene tetrahydromethanopterin reductase-like flavin-dependent oxidoreductase (luciferase family)